MNIKLRKKYPCTYIRKKFHFIYIQYIYIYMRFNAQLPGWNVHEDFMQIKNITKEIEHSRSN